MVKKRRDFEETAALEEPMVVEETSFAEDVRANLEEIKTYDGIIGYIVRNSTSAAIDLKDPAELVNYAILSSSSLDVGKQLAEAFDLGEANSVIVEGKDSKMLSLTIGESKISVFMEKETDCERILRKLR